MTKPLQSLGPVLLLFISVLLQLTGCALRSGPTGEYSVSGTVVGVTKPGVLLSDANGAGVLVASDGRFVIENAFSNGSKYDIQVATDPALPSVRCTVAKGKGTIHGSDRDDVVVACTDSGT